MSEGIDMDVFMSDMKVIATQLIKDHNKINCGNNKAIDFIRHGGVIKYCPACTLARKYFEDDK